MVSLTGKGPLGLKPEKMPPDPEYLQRVRGLPCCICERHGMKQNSPTTAHHVIHGRYGQRKTPDRHAIPLCVEHHQGVMGSTRIAIHREPQTWRRVYGPDHGYTEQTQLRLAAEQMQDVPFRGQIG